MCYTTIKLISKKKEKNLSNFVKEIKGMPFDLNGLVALYIGGGGDCILQIAFFCRLDEKNLERMNVYLFHFSESYFFYVVPFELIP